MKRKKIQQLLLHCRYNCLNQLVSWMRGCACIQGLLFLTGTDCSFSYDFAMCPLAPNKPISVNVRILHATSTAVYSTYFASMRVLQASSICTLPGIFKGNFWIVVSSSYIRQHAAAYNSGICYI